MTGEARRTALQLAAAVGCALLVVRAVPSLRAEWVYGQARGFGSSPAEDRPGRLEAYAEAAELDNGEFVYRFRAGQILLDRAREAARTRDPSKNDLLDRALEEFAQAAARQPFDPRVRASWAEALLRRRRVDAAREQLDHAVRLGPRHPDVLARAVRLHLLLWRGTRDTAHLTEALSIAAAADGIGAPAPADGLARTLASGGPRVLPDLLEATTASPELARFAAERLRSRSPELADGLEADLARRRP